MEVTLFRPWSAVLAALAAIALLAPAPAFAAAEIHRINFAISGVPTQVNAGDFNETLDFYNRVVLQPRGFDSMERVKFSFLFDGEFRYFVTRNLSINAGLGHLRAKSTKEYLPALAQSINVKAEIITVPIHIGASYYAQAYNQGDFQARLFGGGGLIQYSHSRISFLQQLAGADSATTAQLGGSFQLGATQDAPGYYAEGGVHMFFAARYSVLLSALYRSGEIAHLVDERTQQPFLNPETGEPFKLDVGGIGFRMAAVIGF
jgi:hypothetical protein